MRKDKQSKRILDESPLLTDLVNHGQTYTEIRDMIEDENEEKRKSVLIEVYSNKLKTEPSKDYLQL